MATKYNYYEGATPFAEGGVTNLDSTADRDFQTFTPSVGYSITSIKVVLRKVNSPTGIITAGIRFTGAGNKPVGSDLVTGTLDSSTLPTSFDSTYTTITLSSALNLEAGTEYCIVLKISAADGSNYVQWSTDNSAPADTAGFSTNSEASWSTTTTYNARFQTYGDPPVPTDKIYSKKLVVIGNNEVWYESIAGTMTELTAANGDIDVGNPLMAIAAFGKVFIANKDRLKIADFTNTKISTNDAGANPTHRNNILTGATSGAQMVIDYADGITDDAAANIYGYRTTAATFQNGETVTGTNDDGDAISFVLSAAETAPPHWYDWTVYGNDTTTYGIMPSQATIVCLFNGRIVLAGDCDYPHQWYMPEVLNPFNWLYDSNNPLTPIRGGDSDAGEIGDIITAMISPKDDLIIHGCANSIWAIIGDPAFHGQIGNITKNTGIWGPRAWCIDGSRNFYFLGDDGLYKMEMGETISAPVNISQPILPTLMDDLALNKSLHRVILTYDGDNNGILISKMVFSSGSNTNYWFDLRTQGFFPESYPTTQAILSSYKYNATNKTYAKLLIGCNDGYIREFDPDTKNDDGTTIDSYVTVGPLSFANSPSMEGSIGPIDIILAGGASSGSETDSDDADYKVFVADTAAELIEKLVANGTPSFAGTVTGPGRRRGSRRTQSARGVYGGVRVGNDTAGEAFIFECIDIRQKPRGRSK